MRTAESVPAVRPQDLPLQEDVRRLGAMLGQAIDALSFLQVDLLGRRRAGGKTQTIRAC